MKFALDKFGDFLTGCIVWGVSRIHANSDDTPWENNQKSIIIRVFRPFVRIMMDLVDFPKECYQNSHGFSKLPIQCTQQRSLQQVNFHCSFYGIYQKKFFKNVRNPNHHYFRQEKKEPKPKLLRVQIFSGGVGVFHVKGWGPKKFGMSLETREIKLFWAGYPGLLPGYPGSIRKFEKKKFVFNFWPLHLSKKYRNTPPIYIAIIRTHWIGANPEKNKFSKLSGSALKKI